MDQNLTPMQQMIYTGQFGYNGPAQPQASPYTQYQGMFNMNMPQMYNTGGVYPNNTQGYTFQPIPQQYQRPTYNNPYANVNFNTINGPMVNPYAYNNAGGYYQGPYGYQNPYMYQQQQFDYAKFMQIRQAKINADKIMYRIAAGSQGRVINEEWLEARFNPKPIQQKPKTYEQIIEDQRWALWQKLAYWSNNPGSYVTADQMAAHHIACMSEAFHKEFDNHSLCQFLEDDLWKLQREEWIKKNIKLNYGHNLSSTYNSKEYNELLAMHRSSSPYVSELLDNSRYDNNIDDAPIGMQTAIEKGRRAVERLNSPVPDYISSPEMVEHRARYIDALMQNLYKKKGGAPPGVQSSAN